MEDCSTSLSSSVRLLNARSTSSINNSYDTKPTTNNLIMKPSSSSSTTTTATPPIGIGGDIGGGGPPLDCFSLKSSYSDAISNMGEVSTKMSSVYRSSGHGIL